VSATKAVAEPLTTWVPMKRQFVLAATGASCCASPAPLAAGKLSPVRVASSTDRSLDSRMRQSPGTVLPAERSTMSPLTTSSAGACL